MYNMRRYWPISPAVRVVMTDPQLDDDIIATCINKNKQNNYYYYYYLITIVFHFTEYV